MYSFLSWTWCAAPLYGDGNGAKEGDYIVVFQKKLPESEGAHMYIMYVYNNNSCFMQF